MSPPDIYVRDSVTFVLVVIGGLAVVLLGVVGCCTLVNGLARRPLLNGWLWGGAAVVSLVVYDIVAAYRAEQGPGPEPDPHVAEELGISVAVLLLLAIAAWRAVAWRRRQRNA